MRLQEQAVEGEKGALLDVNTMVRCATEDCFGREYVPQNESNTLGPGEQPAIHRIAFCSRGD